MIILGSNSDISKAYLEYTLSKNENYSETIYLFSSNIERADKYKQHLTVLYPNISVQVLEMDLTKNFDLSKLKDLNFSHVFCATGFLGQDTVSGLYSKENTSKIIDINYSKLIPVILELGNILESKKEGSIVVLSSVAGERGRFSNFVYGSAKAGLTAFLSGYRAYLSHQNVHLMTVKPGFMATQMTAELDLPGPLTAEPLKVAKSIYKANVKRKNQLYILPIWRLIMFVIKSIPEFVFKKLKL